MLADAAVIMTIVAARGYVVPGPSIADGTTWMLPLASTAVYIPALALSPALSLPTAAAVTAVYVLTVPHPGDAGFLMSKASVGRRMAITENTVRQYIDRARMKYAATGRPAPTKDALLARAIEDGLVRPSEVAVYTSWAFRETT